MYHTLNLVLSLTTCVNIEDLKANIFSLYNKASQTSELQTQHQYIREETQNVKMVVKQAILNKKSFNRRSYRIYSHNIFSTVN